MCLVDHMSCLSYVLLILCVADCMSCWVKAKHGVSIARLSPRTIYQVGQCEYATVDAVGKKKMTRQAFWEVTQC